jgi:hypothetical protein
MPARPKRQQPIWVYAQDERDPSQSRSLHIARAQRWALPPLIDHRSPDGDLLDGRTLLRLWDRTCVLLSEWFDVKANRHTTPTFRILSPSEAAEELLRASYDPPKDLRKLIRDRLLPTTGDKRPKGESGPLGMTLFHDTRVVKRNNRKVEFRGRNVAWKMLTLLCKRHPVYYPTEELGHSACNEDWQADDPGLNTLYNHVAELNRLLKPLAVRAKFTRGSGYRLEITS